ncbi:hypothetical protein ACIGMX_12420 [Streptomyces aquilus]|uniref:hypothetical protein n=1 Tax=Streptomyces aquilus TaxID=2548456 RepID=UPI0037D90C5C
MIKPLRMWQGGPVPWVTAWTGEVIPPQRVREHHGIGGRGLGLVDEHPAADRVLDVLWVRMPATRTGVPDFAMMHALRQRTALLRGLCQLCGGAIGDSPEGVLFLLGPADGRPIGEGERTMAPPVHRFCARTAVRACPPLRRHGHTAALVSHTLPWGVQGLLYSPDTLEPIPSDSHGLHFVPYTDAASLRWVIAIRYLVTLHGVRPVDLADLPDEPITPELQRTP